jgi:hypothetical protein
MTIPLFIPNFLSLFQAGRDEFRVCVIEKAATVGGHILSGDDECLTGFVGSWNCVYLSFLYKYRPPPPRGRICVNKVH